MANIARYHRSAKPKLKHKGFAALDPEDREVVLTLASILRFADGLDRSHTNAVEDLTLEQVGDVVLVRLYPRTGNEIERWAGQKKSRFFQEIFGLEVRILPGA